MRSWERKDITDILIKHHENLRTQASLLEWNLGEELDDDCIVIENFLEENYQIVWNGLEFVNERTS